MQKVTKRFRKKDTEEIILDLIRYVCITFFVLICIFPFYYVMIYSVSDPGLASKGVWLLPKGFSLETYRKLLTRNDLGLAFLVSVGRTGIGTGLCVFFTSMFAFLVTRKEMPGRKIIYRYVVITMYIGAGLVPWYLTMKGYGLKDSFLLYVIPGAVNAYYMILIKTFMEQLPESLEESAAIEGAGFFTILFKIILPLSKPIIATVAVYCAVGQWNSWMDNFFLVNNTKLQTVQLILYNYLNSATALAKSMQNGGTAAAAGAMNAANAITPQSVQMTSIVITVIPVMLVYPYAQKYFTKGIMMGAVKG